ncbi:MAG: glycosyltransferase family 1 protein [Flavobacterium sp.]|nr:glycosyltransferase family 1 protein [Aeromicrobium sp.]
MLNNLHPAERGVNCRLFEAAGSGGAVLCDAREPLRDLFEDGSEVLTFTTYDDLLALCIRLTRDPDLTRRIGDAAAARAHAEHTYQHRLRVILEDLV